MFVPGFPSPRNAIVPRLAGNYSPVHAADESRCSRARSIKTSRECTAGVELIRARSLTISEENSWLEERSSPQRGCSATRGKEAEGMGKEGLGVELQATPLCATLGFDPFLCSPLPGDRWLKGNADTRDSANGRET